MLNLYKIIGNNKYKQLRLQNSHIINIQVQFCYYIQKKEQTILNIDVCESKMQTFAEKNLHLKYI